MPLLFLLGHLINLISEPSNVKLLLMMGGGGLSGTIMPQGGGGLHSSGTTAWCGICMHQHPGV